MHSTLKSLRNFNSYCYLQNLLYFYTSNILMTKEENEKLSKIFCDLDEDNDGILNFNELITAFVKTGRTPERYFPNNRSFQLASKLLKELNLQISSGIEYKQFLVTCCNKEKILNEKALKASFEMWDVEGKGSINLNDIKKVGADKGVTSGAFDREL